MGIERWHTKQYDERTFLVFIDPKSPFKVRMYEENGDWFTSCQCDVFQLCGRCIHCIKVVEKVNRPNVKLPPAKKLKDVEFIGGDLRKQIGAVVKTLKY